MPDTDAPPPRSHPVRTWRKVGELRDELNYRVPVLRCPTCLALVAQEDAEGHAEYHTTVR